MSSLLNVLSRARGTVLDKRAFEPPQPATPPMDPAAAGGAPPMPPMDPAAAGGAPPMPQMDPAAAGGAPPMPQIDPAMLQQALADPGVQQMLQQVGIIVDPQQGPIDIQTGQPIPQDQLIQILQQLMAQMPPPAAAGGAPVPPQGAPMPKAGAEMMPPAMAGGAPPMDPAAVDPSMAPPMDPAAVDPSMAPPMDPSMAGGAPSDPMQELEDLKSRVTELEDKVSQLTQSMGISSDQPADVVDEGLTPEAQDVLGGDIPKESSEKKPTRKEDPSRRLSRLVNRVRTNTK